MSGPLRVAVIIGSTRPGRLGPAVAAWFADQAVPREDVTIDLIDLADADTPIGPRLATADAFVVVTPEYNHSYPASLKALIDWHFQQWAAKPVAFTSYGGASGGRHAVLHLENVFTELHAVTIRDGLAFPNYFVTWNDGEPQVEQAPELAKVMFDHLDWWAKALRSARVATPYPGAA